MLSMQVQVFLFLLAAIHCEWRMGDKRYDVNEQNDYSGEQLVDAFAPSLVFRTSLETDPC